MNYYLLVYDNRRDKRLQRLEFARGDRAIALKSRRELQAAYESQPEVEVVLFGAERFEDLAITHGRFFKSVEEMSVAASTDTGED